MKWLIFSSLLILGAVWCQDDFLKDIPNLPDLNVNDIETAAAEQYAKDALVVLKQKCANTTGGDQVYAELESKANALKTFITDNINFTVVMSELEEAKKTGSMDEVFAKYCARKPEAMARLRNITEAFKKCLLTEEQKSIDLKLNLTEKMVNFLCEKDGDKIAMFIANGGEECLTAKVDGLQNCFNKSSSMFPSANWQSVSLLEVDEAVCEEYPVLETCVVTVLEECKVKTPANIVGALFKYLRKGMECAPQKESINAPDQRKLNAFVDNNRLKRSIVTSVQNQLHTKCTKNSPNNPQAYNNLNSSFQAFTSALFNNVFIANGNCSALKRDTQFPRDAFLLYLKECLTAQEDFLGDFIRQGVDGVFDYLCADNSEKLKEYRSAQGLQCLIQSDRNKFNNCAQPTSVHSTDGGQVILKSEQFCEDVTAVRKCIKKELLQDCGYDPHFKKISEDLLKIIDNKCSGCSIFANTFLLCLLALYHFYKHW